MWTNQDERIDAGLRRLLTATPGIEEGALGADGMLGAGGDGQQYVALGPDLRPRGLVDFNGQLHQVRVVDIDDSPASVVHVIATSIDHPVVLPVIVTDAGGHYVGTVGLHRLLSAIDPEAPLC